jgi:hypothetical protein
MLNCWHPATDSERVIILLGILDWREALAALENARRREKIVGPSALAVPVSVTLVPTYESIPTEFQNLCWSH